ncbi:diguanylate cyclase domain-containing protein [Micromonospora zamorensis]|uniref:diguanylate cyclase domain-containing protein n=1 Tax=Micromonospora zamorensis TaxID=709883 RepID=UPI003D8DFA1D
MLVPASSRSRKHIRSTVVLMVAVVTALATTGHPVSAGLALQASTEPVSLERARWIWYPENAPPDTWPAETRYLRRAFTAPAGPYTDAQMVITADDDYDLWLNGTYLDSSPRTWERARYIDLSRALRPGTNTLEISTSNSVTGSAGVIGRVHIATATSTVDLITDGSWVAAKSARGPWVAVKDIGAYGVEPWRRNVAPPDTGTVPPDTDTAEASPDTDTGGVPPDVAAPPVSAESAPARSNGFRNVTLWAVLLIAAAGISILGYRIRGKRRRSDEWIEDVFQHAPDMVAVLDAEGQIGYSSPNAAAVLHLPPGSLQGSSIFNILHPEDHPRMRLAIDELRAERNGVQRLQIRMIDFSGTPIWFEITASIEAHNPELTGIVLHARDISETRALQEHLRHEATHDALTGLPNRRQMEETLDSSLRNYAVAVLFLDLDGLKPVNDSLGHGAGDDLLRQVASRLSGCIREGDLLARVGGDEFVVLMPGVINPADADRMSQLIGLALQRPFKVQSHKVVIGASVGVHLARAGDDPDQALREADEAMYAVKHAGRSRQPHGADAYQSGQGRTGRHRDDANAR